MVRFHLCLQPLTSSQQSSAASQPVAIAVPKSSFRKNRSHACSAITPALVITDKADAGLSAKVFCVSASSNSTSFYVVAVRSPPPPNEVHTTGNLTETCAAITLVPAPDLIETTSSDQLRQSSPARSREPSRDRPMSGPAVSNHPRLSFPTIPQPRSGNDPFYQQASSSFTKKKPPKKGRDTARFGGAEKGPTKRLHGSHRRFGVKGSPSGPVEPHWV